MDYEDEIDAAAEAALLADQGQTNLASNVNQEEITPNAQSTQGQISQHQQGEGDLPSLQTNLLFEEETTASSQGQVTHAASSLQGQTIQMEPANSSQGHTTSTTTTTVISKLFYSDDSLIRALIIRKSR